MYEKLYERIKGLFRGFSCVAPLSPSLPLHHVSTFHIYLTWYQSSVQPWAFVYACLLANFLSIDQPMMAIKGWNDLFKLYFKDGGITTTFVDPTYIISLKHNC